MEKPCVFCDRSQFEERLIGEKNGFWIIATLGQITDGGYILIVPQRHVPCLAAMTPEELTVFNGLSADLFFILGEEYHHLPTVFEHGIVGQTIQHAHLHMLPALCDMKKRIAQDFPNCERETVHSFLELGKSFQRRQTPYLLWKDNVNILSRLNACWNPISQPQYWRIVAAELLGRPERANWKTMDPELDKKLSQETVHRLKPILSL